MKTKHYRALGGLIALLLLLLSGPVAVQAYDQPWNGYREDITGPGNEPDGDCPSGNCDPCPGDNNTGSPVYIAKGYLVWSDTDIRFPTDTNIGLRRTYNSFDLRAGLFGRGWMSAQEVNIARTYKAVTEGNADGSPKTADEFEPVPIYMAAYGRRYKLQETATTCTPPGVLYFHFEKLPDGGFKQVYEDSQSYHIYSDTGALLRSYNDRDGTSVYYHYDSDNRLIQQIDSDGFALDLSYNDQGFVSQVTDQAGRSWYYSYDDNGNLTQVLDPDGNSRDYGYRTVDKTGYQRYLLTSVDDNLSDPVLSVDWTETTLYSKDGFRVSRYIQYDGEDAGKRHDYSYSQTTYNSRPAVRVSKATKQVNSNTTVESQIYTVDLDTYRILSRSNNSAGTSRQDSFNARGKLQQRIDERGNITRYEYNQAGRQTRITELAGTAAEKVISIRYFNDTDRVAVRNEYGLREIRYTYDSDLRLRTQTLVDLNSGEQRLTTYRYHPNSSDAQGNPILGKLASIDGPQDGPQDTTRFSYDARGLLTRIDRPAGLSDSYSYNAAGQRSTETDANGTTTTLRYDSRNRLTATETAGRITRYRYDRQGQLTTLTDPLNRTTQFSYNDLNQPTQITYPSGDYLAISYQYTGSYTQTTTRYYNASGALLDTRIERANPRTGLTTQRYLQNTSTQVTDQQYNGLDDLTGTTAYGQFGSASQSSTAHRYDSQGRLIQSTDATNGATQFAYDRFDRTIQVTDPNNGITAYHYNALDDLQRRESPDTGTTTYQQDAAGNRIERIDAQGRTTHYRYDALNRPTAIDYPGTDLDTTLSYDQGPLGKGQLTAVTDGSGSSHYQYDDRGLLTQADTTVAGIDFQTGYQYNDAGQLNRIDYPSGLAVLYRYDSAGRLSGIQRQDPGASDDILSAITWHGTDWSGYRLGNGLNVTLQYDSAGRLTGKTYGSNANQLQNQLDNQGQITRQTWVRDNRSDTSDYRYDPLGRLQNDGAGDWQFSYDPVGNRLSEAKGDGSQSRGYGYDAASNRLNQIEGTPITLDAAGNTLDDGQRRYQYDAMNRLSQVTDIATGTQADYTHNYRGERVRKLVSGTDPVDIRFVYGQDGELLGEYDSNGNRIREYVYQRQGAYPVPVAQIEADGKVHYLHTDHLGTPRLASDENQVIVWRWDSDAFGTTAVDADPDQDGSEVTVNLRFLGQYFDQETGLHYNYFRTYDPSTGRYLESDPIGILRDYSDPDLLFAIEFGALEETGFSGGVVLNHLYGYVGQNPLSWVDPFGLASKGNKGDGSATGKNTGNPYKHCREVPGKPDKIKCKRKRDGKWVEVPKPADWPGNNQNRESCGETCKKAATVVVVGGTAYIVYRCVRMLPSLAPPFWWTIPGNLAAP